VSDINLLKSELRMASGVTYDFSKVRGIIDRAGADLAAPRSEAIFGEHSLDALEQEVGRIRIADLEMAEIADLGLACLHLEDLLKDGESESVLTQALDVVEERIGQISHQDDYVMNMTQNGMSEEDLREEIRYRDRKLSELEDLVRDRMG
jgi:hypothetical protein